MLTLSVSIPPEVESFIRSAAQARGETDEEFLRQHLIEASARHAALQEEIRIGIESLDQGRGVAGADVFTRLRERNATFASKP